jgi:hypothetical protein
MNEPGATPSTYIQINFYRMMYGRFEYLVLKPIGEDKDLWQAVTQQVSATSDIANTVKQAAIEQVGVRSFVRLSEEMYTYEWYTHGQRGRDIVFAAELDPRAVITIDTSRYSQFQWLPFEAALLSLKWLGAKDGLRDLNRFLESKKLSNPEYWPNQESGLFSSGHTFDVGQAVLEHTSNPYGDNVSKRLPDHPDESHESKDDDKEVNTGEWFL